MTFRCPGEGFGHHFGRLLVTLGSLFLDCEGTGKKLEFYRFPMDFGSLGASRSKQVHARSCRIWGWSALTSLLVYMEQDDRQEDRRHKDRKGKTAKDQQTHYGLKARWRI